MNIKQLNWSAIQEPNEDIRYDHVLAKAGLLGTFSIEWKSWKDYPGYVCYLNGNYLECCDNLDEATKYCQEYIDTLILSLVDL